MPCTGPRVSTELINSYCFLLNQTNFWNQRREERMGFSDFKAIENCLLDATESVNGIRRIDTELFIMTLAIIEAKHTISPDDFKKALLRADIDWQAYNF